MTHTVRLKSGILFPDKHQNCRVHHIQSYGRADIPQNNYFFLPEVLHKPQHEKSVASSHIEGYDIPRIFQRQDSKYCLGGYRLLMLALL